MSFDRLATELSLDLAGVILGPLHNLGSSPDRALAAAVGTTTPLAEVIPLRPDIAVPEPRPVEPAPREVGDVFQLKVTLRDTKPAVWRRVLVDGSSTLDHIHEVIQAAFGWWDYHLHDFEIDGTSYGVPDPDDDDWGVPTIDETGARLDSIAGPGSRLLYRYDFGDNWRHEVVVEKVLPADGSMVVPTCVDGRRACPPEDCGSTGGFGDLLKILADARHPEHRERREWMGRDYDPAAFDPSEFEDNLRRPSSPPSTTTGRRRRPFTARGPALGQDANAAGAVGRRGGR
ncbi:MAG: plasmid pRiA4b ORF-3 family protein [Acidimicrobiales bacterium]